MRATAVLMSVVIAALTFGSANATVRIRDDMGGLMTDYASKFANMRHSGEKVVIDGPCYSACTMLLGMLSRDQVCVTPNAVLGFHAAWNFDDAGHRVTSTSATQAFRRTALPRSASSLMRASVTLASPLSAARSG